MGLIIYLIGVLLRTEEHFTSATAASFMVGENQAGETYDHPQEATKPCHVRPERRQA